MWEAFVILLCISGIIISVTIGYFIYRCIEKFINFMSDGWIWNDDKEKEDFE